MPGGIDGAAAERLRRPTPRPPDQEDIAPSVQALLGEVLERRYRPDTVVEVRDEVAWLRGASIANGTPVDFLVVAPAASEARRVAFSRQAELVARLDHPGCPRFLEFGSRPDGTLFVVHSPVPIRSVRSLFATPMKVELALALAGQLLDIVGHIHEQGVVHGNLTPEAVRVGGQGARRQLHVVDFSEAALIGEVDVEPALDVYGVGLILYHLLAGRGPFADGRGTEPAPLPRSVPDGLRSVVAKMVSADPRSRFVGAAEAAHALQHWSDEGADGRVAKSRLTQDGVVSEDRAPLASDAPPVRAGLPAAVAALVDELGSGSQEAASAPVVPLPEEEAEPTLPTRTDPPADGPTGQVVAPAAAPPETRRSSSTWIYVAVLLLGLSAVAFAILRGSGSNRGAEADAADPIRSAAAVGREPVAGAGARATVEDAKPLGESAESAESAAATAAAAIDPMEALTRINDTDLDGAPSYEQRQRYLERVRATPSTAALVDEELNATLDLLQASQASAPCETFGAGLARLEQEMSPASRARLCGASVEVPTPGEDEDPGACAAMGERLEALCAEEKDVAEPARRRPSARRKPAAPPPAAAAAPAPATAPSRPKAKPRKRTTSSIGKLDDELRHN